MSEKLLCYVFRVIYTGLGLLNSQYLPSPPAVDTESDPRAPKLHKVAEPEDIQAATGKPHRLLRNTCATWPYTPTICT